MIDEFEDTARLGMQHVRAFLLHDGEENPMLLQKAKIGAMAMGAYTRLRATRANERALWLATRRGLPVDQRGLPPGGWDVA